MEQSRDALGLGKSFYLMSGCSGRNEGCICTKHDGLAHVDEGHGQVLIVCCN